MDKYAVPLMCLMLLLINLLGGIVSTALYAYEKPGPELPLKSKLSFRAFLVGIILFLALAIYYHMSYSKPNPLEWVFWAAAFSMAPLIAKFGSLLSGMIYGRKLEARKQKYDKWVEDNMTDDEKVARDIDAQSKITDDATHDDFAFMKNYTKDELK